MYLYIYKKTNNEILCKITQYPKVELEVGSKTPYNWEVLNILVLYNQEFISITEYEKIILKQRKKFYQKKHKKRIFMGFEIIVRRL